MAVQVVSIYSGAVNKPDTHYETSLGNPISDYDVNSDKVRHGISQARNTSPTHAPLTPPTTETRNQPRDPHAPTRPLDPQHRHPGSCGQRDGWGARGPALSHVLTALFPLSRQAMTNTSVFLQHQARHQNAPCPALINPVQLTPQGPGWAGHHPCRARRSAAAGNEWKRVVGNGNRGIPVAERYRKADIRRHHLVMNRDVLAGTVHDIEFGAWKGRYGAETDRRFSGSSAGNKESYGEGTLRRTGRVLIRGGDAYAGSVPECKGSGMVEVAALGWMHGVTIEFECFARLLQGRRQWSRWGSRKSEKRESEKLRMGRESRLSWRNASSAGTMTAVLQFKFRQQTT